LIARTALQTQQQIEGDTSSYYCNEKRQQSSYDGGSEVGLETAEIGEEIARRCR
jgi:hypothetical protein